MNRLTRRSLSEYELLPRSSSDSDHLPEEFSHAPPKSPWLWRLRRRIPIINKLFHPSVYTRYMTTRRRKRSLLRLVYLSIASFPFILLFLVLFTAIFFPSYTVRPVHYAELRDRALKQSNPGRANQHNEKVFIAAALYEKKGHLTSGAWGRAVLELVDLLGPENVHLSVYEDNADPETIESLRNFRHKAICNVSIAHEDLRLDTLPRITLPTGETRLKRIAFLAEVRNRALAPIDSDGVQYDKVLYLNDVMFNPIEAAQLLFATNIDSNGRASYSAACAVDFILPLKFYDRFATRDLDGFITGVPFFPWFTNAGSGTSRREALAGKDAIRVRSCWGGMVAFEAKWFQNQASVGHTSDFPDPGVSPIRFRYEKDTFWDSSECCLIHADLQYRRTGKGMPEDSGIYMNPFVRVAYEESTLSWLSLARRPEKLLTPMQGLLTYLVGFTEKQDRLGEEPGSVVTDTVWVYDDPTKGLAKNATKADLKGHYAKVTRVAEPGGFCGARNLLVINETPEQGPGKWGKILPPAPPS